MIGVGKFLSTDKFLQNKNGSSFATNAEVVTAEELVGESCCFFSFFCTYHRLNGGCKLLLACPLLSGSLPAAGPEELDHVFGCFLSIYFTC